MTDYPLSPAPEDLDESRRDEVEDPAHEPEEPTHTGLPAVDDVLAEVARLDETPLEEHLPAFERVHEALRSALDADPGEPA
jgi:hypothetical protein